MSNDMNEIQETEHICQQCNGEMYREIFEDEYDIKVHGIRCKTCYNMWHECIECSAAQAMDMTNVCEDCYAALTARKQ